MSRTISETMQHIHKIMRTIDGLKEVPNGVPDAVKATPCCFALIESGEFNADFGGDDTYLVTISLLVSKADNPSQINRILPFLESFKNKFDAKQTLNDSVSWCRLAGFSDVGIREFAGIEYLGIDFQLEVME